MAVMVRKKRAPRGDKTPHTGLIARHIRVRRKVVGSTERPRLSVFRSLNHIYCQVVDDSRSHTLASASSREKEIQGQGVSKTLEAQLVGRLIAERAKMAGIQQAVFDRGGNRYHGRVKALADAAREGGLRI